MRPRLVSYLTALQGARFCDGLDSFARAQDGGLPHKRTIYRWHRRLGSSLVVAPVFALESLGLCHVHAFLEAPRDEWVSFPYLVEYSWVTPDCISTVLYVHCVVPVEHVRVVVGRLSGLGHSCVIVQSRTGWERLLPSDDLVPFLGSVRRADHLLREFPLIVPVVFESYGRTLRLDQTWHRIQSRLGARVRSFLPRQRLYATNGKRHVRHACAALSSEGLFVQYAVRHRSPGDRVDAFVVEDGARASWLLRAIAGECSMVAAHPGEHEWVLRATGTGPLFERLLSAGARRVYWVHRRLNESCSVEVGFRYDVLFDPKRGEWLLPEGWV